MPLDFTPYFQRYETLVKAVDQLFEQVANDHPDQVRCGKGCSDCCYALFDLTLVEAAYLNHHFNRKFEGLERSAILERADEADRQIYKIKRRIYKASQEGIPTSEILREVAEQKVRCPLLGDDDLCVLYEHRPITCRLYGIPTAIGDQAHTCHRSGFEPGQPYPTVQMAKLQDQLYVISHELAQGVRSRFTEVGDMLVPPSMALMNRYDEEYLNVAPEGEELPGRPVPAASGPASCASCGQDQATCGQDASSCSGCSPDSSITLGRADEEDKA